MITYNKGNPSKFDVIQLKKIGDATYHFENYAPSDKDLVIEPRLIEDSNLLFYPK